MKKQEKKKRAQEKQYQAGLRRFEYWNDFDKRVKVKEHVFSPYTPHKDQFEIQF
jgi:hypothetical protein